MDRMKIRGRAAGEDRFLVEGERVTDMRMSCVTHELDLVSGCCKHCGRDQQEILEYEFNPKYQ